MEKKQITFYESEPEFCCFNKMKLMKNIIILLLGVILTTGLQPQDQTDLTGKVKVEVDGLSCPFCAYGLEKKLKDLDGVSDIEIDVENAFALLTVEEGKALDEEAIRKKVKDAGFTARTIKKVIDEG